jgi:hypothetical protein
MVCKSGHARSCVSATVWRDWQIETLSARKIKLCTGFSLISFGTFCSFLTTNKVFSFTYCFLTDFISETVEEK